MSSFYSMDSHQKLMMAGKLRTLCAHSTPLNATSTELTEVGEQRSRLVDIWGHGSGTPLPQLRYPACPVHAWCFPLFVCFVFDSGRCLPDPNSDPSLLNRGWPLSLSHLCRELRFTFFYHLFRKRSNFLLHKPSKQIHKNIAL